MCARLPSFDAYVDELRELAVRAGQAGFEAAERARTWAELDGNASRVFRRRGALDIRREEGTFITVGDFFKVDHALAARVLLLNPPYGRVQAPDSVDWASGSVSEAGIFAEHALAKLGDNSRFCAILPDVLRSGSRYHAWR